MKVFTDGQELNCFIKFRQKLVFGRLTETLRFKMRGVACIGNDKTQWYRIERTVMSLEFLVLTQVYPFSTRKKCYLKKSDTAVIFMAML
jgi:hypothetical protein